MRDRSDLPAYRDIEVLAAAVRRGNNMALETRVRFVLAAWWAGDVIDTWRCLDELITELARGAPIGRRW
jgi:hypothetical protein